MQGGGGGGGGGGGVGHMIGLQQQDRRMKPPPPPENQQSQQPQKCPRCESLNTKFCYYNNYSLSQPRYFCKTCRRYWTQGGTLRNVPVGGGCRKGKRSKRPSSDQQNQNPPLQTPQQVQNQEQQQFTLASSSGTTSSNLRKTETDMIMGSSPIAPMAPTPSSIYYPGEGFLSSLAAFQSFNQPNNVGGDFGGSNLALLQGFSPPFSPQVFDMGSRDKTLHQLLPSENVIQQSRPSTSHQEWHQSFINPNNSIKSEAGYWTSNSSNSGPSSNPTGWVADLPGYGTAPSSSQSFL